MLLATRWSHHPGKRQRALGRLGQPLYATTTYVALTQWDRNRTSNSPPGRLRRLSEMPQLRRRSATSNHEHRAQRHGYEKPESRSQAEDAGTAAASLVAGDWVPEVAGRSAHRLLTDPALTSALSDLKCSLRASSGASDREPVLTDRHHASPQRQAVNLPASPTLVRTQHLPHRGAPTSQDATGPAGFRAVRRVGEDGGSLARVRLPGIVQSIGLAPA